jgi:hypothetical protein
MKMNDILKDKIKNIEYSAPESFSDRVDKTLSSLPGEPKH